MSKFNETKLEISGDNEKRTNVFLFIKTCFHFVFVVHFWVASGYGVYMYMSVTEKQLEEPLIRMAKTYVAAYGTIWNASFQTVFLCLAFVHDVLQWLDKHESKLAKKIKYYRDIIFNGLVFPFTCFVTGMFWCVYLIDRELVFPQVYDQIVPWWLNHCVHTNILVVIAIETLLTTRRYPTDVKVERILVGFVSVFYAVVYYSIYFFGGCWLYGVFGVMTWWQVCLYQAGIWFMTGVFYHMAFVINRLIHKEEETVNTDSKTANGDFESKETTFSSKNGNDFKNLAGKNDKLGNDLESNGAKDQNGHNGESVNGKTNEAYLPSDNGDVENGKEWKSIGVNGNGEVDDNGSLNQPSFDKSWSTKYRTNRSQFDKASL